MQNYLTGSFLLLYVKNFSFWDPDTASYLSVSDNKAMEIIRTRKKNIL